MGKETNGNIKTRWLLGAASGLVATIGIGAIGWYVGFDNNRAVAQGAALTEHAVDIASTKATQRGLRDDMARVEKAIGKNADKLDRLLERTP